MRQVYCDNGSTSFPKAPGLGTAMGQHIDNHGLNISRGGYEKAYDLEATVIEVREKLCSLFGFRDLRNTVFTSGATIGINMVLNGLLNSGDHVITTSMEHNAVVRPLSFLAKKGVLWQVIKCNNQGILDFREVEDAIKSNTKLVFVTHGSNVCGTIIPVEKIGEICKRKGVFFGIDAAQTAGSVNISMKKANIDALVLSGHKGLLGPQGIGGLLLKSTIVSEIDPVIYGGTGSLSDSEAMPEFMPDKFQPGTLNIPGIVGLKHSLDFIEKTGLDAIKEKKVRLTELFLQGVLNMNNIKVLGLRSAENRCAVVSLDFKNMDNAEAGYMLESQYGILTRCGIHCAPLAHKTLETFPQGTVRFSFGFFNCEKDIEYVIDSIKKIMQ